MPQRPRVAASGTNLAIALGAMAAVAVTIVGLYRWVPKSPLTTAAYGSLQIRKLTESGNITAVAVSPDGKTLATVAGGSSLCVQPVGSRSQTVLIPPSRDAELRDLAFSPDGTEIYFTAVLRATGASGLAKVPAGGGSVVPLLPNVGSAVAFRRDGKMTFVHSGSWPYVAVANADGSGDQMHVSFAQGVKNDVSALAWSRDGRVLASAFRSAPAMIDLSAGAKSGDIRSRVWTTVNSVGWLDAQTLVAAASVADPRGTRIWRIDTTTANVDAITPAGTTGYSDVSIPKGGDFLVALARTTTSQLWRVPLDGTAAKQLTTGAESVGQDGVAVLPNGDVLATVRSETERALYLIKPGGERQRLVGANENSWFAMPAVSPSGRVIAYAEFSSAGPEPTLRVAATDGRSINSIRGMWPAFAGDDALWYTQNVNDPTVMWSSLSRDELHTVTAAACCAPSPDGSSTACAQKNRIIITRGNEVASYEGVVYPPLRWTPDGKTLLFLMKAYHGNAIMLQPVRGGPREMLEVPGDVTSFDVAPDGKSVIAAAGTTSGDAVLIGPAGR